jgi:hypothetical protein
MPLTDIHRDYKDGFEIEEAGLAKLKNNNSLYCQLRLYDGALFVNLGKEY